MYVCKYFAEMKSKITKLSPFDIGTHRLILLPVQRTDAKTADGVACTPSHDACNHEESDKVVQHHQPPHPA
jgi:hypothetical protein